MSNVERWTIRVCPDCGAQVHGGGWCRQHHPPGQPADVEVVPTDQLAGTVRALEDMTAERDEYKDRWETLGRVARAKIDRLEAQLQGQSG